MIIIKGDWICEPILVRIFFAFEPKAERIGRRRLSRRARLDGNKKI